MGYAGVSLCDMCGKRTGELPGRLTLHKNVKMKDGWISNRQQRRWDVCVKCIEKLTSMQTLGDKIRDDVELYLDNLRIKHNKPNLLNFDEVSD